MGSKEVENQAAVVELEGLSGLTGVVDRNRVGLAATLENSNNIKMHSQLVRQLYVHVC